MFCCLNRRSIPWLAVGLLLILGLTFSGCSQAPDPWKDAKAGQKHVLVTFPPLYCLTQAIAGDDAYVICFLSTESPHEYQFKQTDGIKAKGADLLIFNGLGLDDTFVEKLNNRTRVPTLSVGEAIPKSLLQAMVDDDDDEKDAAKDAKAEDKKGDQPAHHHHHGVHDPHIWLGPPQAMAMADAIGDKLAAVDSAHAAGYKKRTENLKDELKKLHTEGQARFQKNRSRKLVTMHDSIGYFATAFGLEVIDTIQVQPGQAPDAAHLAKLETKCKEKGVDVITYEPMANKSQPEMLQKQLKNRSFAVQLVEFDPVEEAPLAADSVNPDPGFYMQKMRANIDNLARALP
jgi:zinc transport system substrate-binding protein